MTGWDEATPLTVLCADPAVPGSAAARITAALSDRDVLHSVGPRPGKEIDELLGGRVLVIGTDADLAAVATRLQRRELLGSTEVAFAPLGASRVAQLWSLPTGARAVALARRGDPDLVPLVRDDAGGVLVGEATIGPVDGPVYVDEYRLLNGPARGLIVQPDTEKGLSVTVVHRRFGGVGRRPVTRSGRAVQIGTRPATLVADGLPRDRPVERWTYYTHTSPLRLIRGVVD